METTPRTRSSTRQRRAPTPKLSERKKKLFADVEGLTPAMLNPYVRLERIIIEEEADDSDIGPMSPLEFSSSPSTFNEVHRIIQNGKTSYIFLVFFFFILNTVHLDLNVFDFQKQPNRVEQIFRMLCRKYHPIRMIHHDHRVSKMVKI